MRDGNFYDGFVNRRFLKQVLLFALLYYLVFFALDGVIFLLSHVPPKAMNLDPLLLKLANVEQFLVWPRLLLRWLWPGETTPGIFNYILPVLNALVWGAVLAGLKGLWDKARQ
jgi:hypothetical protein